MQKQFRNPEGYLRDNFKTLGDKAELILSLWTEHWNTAHIYAPCVLNKQRNRSNDKVGSVSHADMALQAGYREVGFPFRLGEATILWALK
jgi:hypothetical protein